MSIPITPQISLSPSTFSSSGEVITATVSILNRPDYHGKPAITGLTTITPKIVCSRTPSGVASFTLMVSACETTANAGAAYRDLHFEWDFGDTGGTTTFIDRWNGKTVNLNDSQTGPEAAYCYKTAGTYTITLTAKGRATEGGEIISASTTSILTLGMFFLFLGGATGGTFTLTFDGQTTSAIAFDATYSTIETALIALSNLDATNVRVDKYVCIELFGSLAGATYTFTGNFAGLTGTTGTPQLRTEQSSATASSVSVSDVSGLSAQYFDSTYDGSNGVSNGTESRPYTTAAQIGSFITGGSSRIAHLKRGSTFTMAADIKWDDGYTTSRIVPYGSGAKPILAGSGAYNFEVEGAYGTVGTPVKVGGDIVIEGLSFTHSGNTQMFRAFSTGNGNTSYIFSRYTDFAIIDCDYTSTTTLGDASGLVSVTRGGTTRGGRILSNLYIIGCDLDMGDGNSQAIFVSMDQWVAVIGTTFIGGDENTGTPYVFDHHIYPSIKRHQVYRYLGFGLANKNFCIATNASNDVGAVKYFLCDGCDITGTQDGIEFSNSNNDYDSGRTGHLDECVVQFNLIHSGQISSQQRGIAGANVFHITVRDNLFWDNTQRNITFSDVTKPTLPDIYRNRFYDGSVYVRLGQVGYHHHNSYHRVSTGTINSCLIFKDGETCVELWDSDDNIYYTPNSTEPFFDDTSLINDYISFATWQGYGNDPSGTETDPLWATPDSGVFINDPDLKINWPNGFTTPEYSINGGSSWNAYTDDSYVSIGSTLSIYQTVLFRATTDASTGIIPITVSSRAASLDVAVETAAENLTSTSTGNDVFATGGASLSGVALIKFIGNPIINSNGVTLSGTSINGFILSVPGGVLWSGVALTNLISNPAISGGIALSGTYNDELSEIAICTVSYLKCSKNNVVTCIKTNRRFVARNSRGSAIVPTITLCQQYPYVPK